MLDRFRCLIADPFIILSATSLDNINVYAEGSTRRDNIRGRYSQWSMARVQIPGFKCERCDHIWTPRANSDKPPRVCPRCKSPYWDTPRQRKKHGEKKD